MKFPSTENRTGLSTIGLAGCIGLESGKTND